MSLNIIVTGGFGALGSVVSAAFHQRGHQVCRVDYASSSSTSGISTMDLAAIDLCNAEECAGVMENVQHKMGGLDVLINIAGGFCWETLQDGDIGNWERMHRMNVLTAATMTQAALPAIRSSDCGRIINIGALGALAADAGLGAYAASKSGVHRMTEALAKELADTKVTVNALLPSIIDTDANRQAMPEADTRQWVSPSAIADVMLFLCSAEAASISGALLPVSRGGV